MQNARLTLDAVHDMREMGVALICKDEPIDTRQRGIADMLLAILATMAEWESDRLSEYAKDTRARLISRGRWPGGHPPFGYKSDKDTGQLVTEPEQADLVRRIFSLYTERLTQPFRDSGFAPGPKLIRFTPTFNSSSSWGPAVGTDRLS